jgi:hypothetical protein
VFVAGTDVPIGSVEHAYEARTIGGRSLGFYPSRADAAAALCKAAAWDTDVPGNLLVREVERSSPPPTPTPQPYKGRGSNLFNIGLNA